MLRTFKQSWTWNESGEPRRFKRGMEYDVSISCAEFAEREGLLLEGKALDGAPDNKMLAGAPANKRRRARKHTRK